MDVKRILHITDHTLLHVGCTKEEIAQLCREAVEYECMSVCVPPCFVSYARECLAGRGVKVCTVIGFPNGYGTTETKVAETKDAIVNGAHEIDTVINMSWVKDREWDKIREELNLIRKASEGHILKVIIETDLLTDEEKVELCGIVTECRGDYVKTSTGFFGSGATVEDVALLKGHIGPKMGVKASGGIRSLEKAEAVMDAGATRIGASGLVKAAQDMV